MKKLNIFIISIFLGFTSISASTTVATDTKTDYEKFNADMNQQLRQVDAQIKNLDRELNKKELSQLNEKRSEIDRDLYILRDKKDPYYTELKYDIEREHAILKNDVNNLDKAKRMPASK